LLKYFKFFTSEINFLHSQFCFTVFFISDFFGPLYCFLTTNQSQLQNIFTSINSIFVRFFLSPVRKQFLSQNTYRLYLYNMKIAMLLLVPVSNQFLQLYI